MKEKIVDNVKITEVEYRLTVPFPEEETELEAAVIGAELVEYHYEDKPEKYAQYDSWNILMQVTNPKRDEVSMMTWRVDSKDEGFVEVLERGLYTGLRARIYSDRYEGYPSVCGFTYWYTFRKLRPWIRIHSSFSARMEMTAEDGTVLQIRCREYGEFEIYVRDEYLGSVEADHGAPLEDFGKMYWPEFWRRDNGGRYRIRVEWKTWDFRQELASIEDFYFSKKWVTEEMERTLLNCPHAEAGAKADVKVIALYYDWSFGFNEVPQQYYIISGEKCGEDCWRLYGLVYITEWAWREILVGGRMEDGDVLSLPPTALRKTDVSGRHLEELLETYAPSGWREYI